LKPILLKLAGIELFSYPLFIGVAWGFSFHISRHFLSKYTDISHKAFLRLFVLVFLFAWLGAKLFFLIFSVPDQMEVYANAGSFWLGGGFVFYGGLVGGFSYLLFEVFFLKSIRFKQLGLIVPALAISHGIGRIGCFLTGCCYGTHCDLPWAIKMHGHFRHPVQLYESISLFLLAFISMKSIKNTQKPLNSVFIYAFGYGLIRFSLEFFRGDKVRGIHFWNLSTSQLVSVAIVMSAIIFYFVTNRKTN
jgi:phosphatidylglycerol:prolipoprotein diacylglycerol transferase